jgi:AraC-like DNA-binding protein
LFKFKTFIPDIKLQKWIKSYWIVNYEKITTNIIKEKIIIPYDNVCLQFIINDSKEKISNSTNTLKDGIYICPPSMNRQSLNFNKDLYYIDVSLYPGVFYKLFGIPITELEDKVYNIEELSLNFDLSILETLFNVKDNINSTIYHLENYLFRIFRDFEEDAFLMNIYQLNKNHNLDNFYLQNRLSVRQVQRKVKDFTGISPKSIERINRFYDTLKCIKNNKNFLDFGNIAVENSFYDQSSFIKEFKFFTGLTPKQFLENADNFLQYKCNIFC